MIIKSWTWSPITLELLGTFVRKLCRRLIMDNPPESLVSQIADVFMAKRDEPDQLKQVVRAVIMSDEFKKYLW